MSNRSGPAYSGASEPAPRPVVIGCGNPTRSDDGVALEVIRALRREHPALEQHAELIDAGTAGMDVMFRVRHAARVIIVDACRSGSEPGAIFRLPGREALTPQAPDFSLHGLRWDHALYAGTRMFGADFADRTEVLLIEAGSLEFGIGLSDPVQQAVAKAVALVAGMLAGQGDAGG